MFFVSLPLYQSSVLVLPAQFKFFGRTCHIRDLYGTLRILAFATGAGAAMLTYTVFYNSFF